ncbi:hypothetical protein LBW62_01760 [Ralstonia solanacearum]|uniref:membrane protein n=1 Tax=Ralstonia solanacearum TaxID=305 RepID=UPI0005C6F1F9|nr:membrane protein [Ralstonia solanacearum]MBB6590738.1 hypothetical protein [Ralstonia solanacearum]MBB6594936.1 hypothetical protein [Ralstonia solanacearum]MDB0540088.1 hypothetical protein [Ralstonia solanacearum]MDB0550002.1 hypothetical protein [Ralstonia solanacearum]MDB0554922.1 hypothetical protein [Ralstonia solanacearum]
MDSLFSPAVCAVPRMRLMRHAGALAAIAACLFVLPAHAEVTPDSAGLDLPDVKAINSQPIAKPTRGSVNHETVKPSFQYRDNDGTQIEEYRFKGQAPDIHVKSGMGTSYQMSKPEDSSPRFRERDGDNNRLPSVNLLKF